MEGQIISKPAAQMTFHHERGLLVLATNSSFKITVRLRTQQLFDYWRYFVFLLKQKP